MKPVREWLQQAEDDLSYGEDTLPPQTISDATLLDLDGYMADAMTQLAAAKQVKKWLDTEIVHRLGPGHSVRFGNWFYRAGQTLTYKIREDTRRDFWALVKIHDFAERLFNPNYARKTALEDLGELYREVDPETGEILKEGLEAFKDEFVEEVWTDGLARMDVERATKYAADMEEGKIR